jgi:hypothetical protein
MKNIILVTVAIATAIALSSWILQLVKPVGIVKIFVISIRCQAVLEDGVEAVMKGN